ncbi:MAG: NADH-quinone oxidoreductase subunit F [Chloroflexi bacterium HGW-Chloroflexi-1]|nr:MAG: NADH-quinone oxidoreductase subunit F [Chloroflexi bacterium HGW-Chloroflexi-1]
MAELYRADVLVSCLHGRSPELVSALKQELDRRGLAGEVKVVETGCRGFCTMGPVLTIQPNGIFYTDVQLADVPEIVEETLVKGRAVQRLLYKEPATRKVIPNYDAIPFYSKQMRIVLRNCGMIDPQSIDEYIAVGGYEALGKVLSSMTPEQVIAEVQKSGLRGRGGAGFATGRKWEHTRKAAGEVKYVIANGDEGDPGAFMDRALMEGDPYAVLEGLTIGGFAVGTQQGYIYVRDEYPLAVQNLRSAIDRAHEYGLLGSDVLGSGFDFDIRIVRGAGAFVCGESSALMQSLEGKVGEPRAKHVHATDRGLWDRPSCLNNVETWANIPPIMNKGGEWFASIGTERSKGTKAFCLVGKVRNPGLIEVPMGITLREIVDDIGGGPPKGREIKAVQTGGPSGGCIPASMLDLPVDYESLTEAGSMMGSGGMIVMDDRTCMVDIARYFIDFLKDESCGKCSTCREGIKRMLEILTNISAGLGKPGDIEVLESLAKTVQLASLCGLGKSAPNPVLSTLHYFREEYEKHIAEQFCPAGVCRALIAYQVVAEKCKGCGLCIKACPQEGISGTARQPHAIDQVKCIQCGACFEVCRLDAIQVVPRSAVTVGSNGGNGYKPVREVVR